MAEPNPPPRRRRWPGIVAAVAGVLLGCCGLPALWFVGNPFEHVRDVQPLASIHILREGSLYRTSLASGRDELVLLNRNSELEVYKIGPGLARTRVVPLMTKGKAEVASLTAFPNSPRAVLTGFNVGAVIVNTETGQVENDLEIIGASGAVLVSPDERWLVLDRPRVVVDLQTDKRFELALPRGAKADHHALTFADPNSLFVPCYPPGGYHLCDMLTRQPKWSIPNDDNNREVRRATGDGSRLIIGGRSCEVWDAETGRTLRTHGANQTASAVALHPHTHDYMAGYSPLNYALPTRLDGAVRIWNTEGERLVTFAAHGGIVTWIAVSKTGDYLVTSDGETVKVWDYHALARR